MIQTNAAHALECKQTALVSVLKVYNILYHYEMINV